MIILMEPKNNIIYNIIKNNLDIIYIKNKLWCHLHCYNIDLFDKIYQEHIKDILKYFSIIVTFSEGNNIPSYEKSIYIRCKNKGGDIGGKFVCIRYLIDNNIDFSFILMLHSKSNEIKRNIYFNSLLDNITSIIENLNDEAGIYVNNQLVLRGKQAQWGRNTYHMKYITELLNISCDDYMFPEGNVYILNSEVAKYIFDDRFNLYEKLNTKTSFDYSWFIQYYKMDKNMSIEQAKIISSIKGLHGNNYSTNLGHKGLADCMIEHVFERIVFSVCKKLDKKINIISNDRILSNHHQKDISGLPPNFNWRNYIKLNSDLCNLNERQSIKHYKKYGIFENRQYE